MSIGPADKLIEAAKNYQHPIGLLDLRHIKRNAEFFKERCRCHFGNRLGEIFFSVKSCEERDVVDSVISTGLGAEVMTEKQLSWVLQKNAPLAIAGYQKSVGLMRNGIQHARYYVIDNEEDGRGLLALLEATGVSLQCFVRIKLSPASKQGVPLGYVPILIENFKLRTKARICGFHVHAGWNVQPVDSYTRSFALLRQYSEILQSLDNGDVAYNLGGSFTELSERNLNERLLLYRSLIPEYVSKIYFEPGRAIVGDAGSIMCRVTMVDTSTNRLAIDSCAYVYRLTAGTPRAEIIGGLIKQKNLWALLGVWPSETDILPIVELTGEPRAGDLLLLKNLGAYTHGLEHQFDPEGRYLRIIW